MSIPTKNINFAYIGGSGTWGARFPEDLDLPGVRVISYLEPFATPAGLSGPAKLLEIAGEPVIRFAMHGWHRDDQGRVVPTWICSAQLAWVFKELGVQYALVEGSVGGVQSPDIPGEPMLPWSVATTTDFIQLWVPPETPPLPSSRNGYPRMREPFCSDLRRHLLTAAQQQSEFVAVYNHGVYGCTPIGSFNISSNRAEGDKYWVGDDSPGAMAVLYQQCPQPVGATIARAFISYIKAGPGQCQCNDFLITDNNFPVTGA